MESKPRLSFDDCSSAASSVIRRMTHNSTQRLSLRRSSSPSSTAPTLTSPSNETATSCVSRETIQNECGLHRFIVWAAIKRNSCRRMTAEERRECPLLRCRKRFANHELMLQHLYTCDQLAAAEYWCYDCEKVERFSDAKCRRCLGHPSKRRKVMSMARNFFSSLGHKGRNGHAADPDLDMGDAPPSYDSILEPAQPELSSNEIHEIGSVDVVSAPDSEDTIPSTTTVTLPDSAPESEPEPIVEPVSPLPLDLVAPLPDFPVELDSLSIEDALINWEPSPTPPPIDAAGSSPQPARIRTPDKPILQLHTAGLNQYRSKQGRSKTLAPSSSVRSTCSTASNNSTLSTTSYEITPMSAWSGTWNRAPGFDSNQTSPDDLINMDDLVPSNPVATFSKVGLAKGKDSSHDAADGFLAELPADFPILKPFTTDSLVPSSFDTDPSVFSFDAAVPTELSIESNLALTDSSHVSLDLSELLAQPTWNHFVSAHSLVGSARDTLHVHLEHTMSKLKHLPQSRIAREFLGLDLDAVALAGLKTLNAVLQGNRMTPDAVEMLCFVHLVYSFSLVVHEQHDPSRLENLFMQALAYSAWVPPRDMPEYYQIVEYLWKPNVATDDRLDAMLQVHVAHGIQAANMSDRTRGKQPQQDLSRLTGDAFVSVSQNFLDELEYATLQESSRPEIQASDLSIQHIKDVNLQAQPESPFSHAVRYLLRMLSQQFSSVPGYAARLHELLTRADTSYITIRRLELELMHAGRIFLSPTVFFGHYSSAVRTQIDSLYAQTGSQLIPRITYYQQGIKLIESLIQSSVMPPAVWENAPTAGPSFDALDQYITSITPSEATPLDLMPLPMGVLPGLEQSPAAVSSAAMVNSTISPAHYLPDPDNTSLMGGPSAAATSPSTPAATSPPAKLVEADMCCEICGYRPKGDPKWFGGSMAKHKKLQHATSPPKIYRCPYPGCTSQYKNRPDNLRQHQLDKGHFVDGQEESSRRPSKRKRTK
ncbi:hypothetical protein HJFPF1_03228 [Paramyrothecium foliicola]|nr:hypothetical protein HJFPF1_03228 [Paramyrothecium foliicola]